MKLGLAGSVEYDDNILRSDVRKKDDVVFRITPNVRFIEDEGKFHWGLSYRAPYEKAIQTDRVDGFRHLLYADANYYVSDRTRAFLTDRFSYSDSINRFSTVSEGGTAPAVGTFREPVIRNNATLGAQHSFTPRLAGNLSFTHRLFETDLPSRSDNMVYVGNTNLQYMLDSQHTLGGGAALTFPGGPTYVDTQYDRPPVILPDQPLVPFVEIAGSEDILVNDLNECSEGPGGERIIPEGGLCPRALRLRSSDPEDRGEDVDIAAIKAQSSAADLASVSDPTGGSSTWTFFGEASLNRRWTPRLVSSLIYRRTDSTASGTGSATLDMVSFVTTWQLSELWTFQVRGDFTHRESVTPAQENLTVVDSAGPEPDREVIPLTSLPLGSDFELAHAAAFTTRTVNNTLDTDRWGVGMRMERRLTKHIRASLRYRFNKQNSKWRTAGSSSDFSNNLVTLGVQYDFDQWHLW
jgi:hypothetical protein